MTLQIFVPDRRLGDEINVSVGVGFPALAFQDPARLAAARIIARARRRVAEGSAFAILAVFLQGAVLQALLVAQLDAAEIEHAVLHRGEHALSLAGHGALIERRDDAERQVKPGAAVADLRAGDERRTVAEAGGRGGAAGALRDVLIDLAFLIRARAEALDRGVDEARVQLLQPFPGEAHAIEHARAEILDQHVARLDERLRALPCPWHSSRRA